MKNIYKQLFAALMVTAVGFGAYAQSESEMEAAEAETTSAATTEDPNMTAEEVRAPSPRLQNPDRRGFFQVGVGPAASFGLDTDNAMYNLFASYNRNFGDRWIGKILGDAYLGAGGDSSRMLNAALGMDYAFTGYGFQRALPYVGAAVGFGSARSETEDTETGLTLNAGGGMKFVAADLNWDVNLLYSILTTEVDGSVPSVLGLRAGVNF